MYAIYGNIYHHYTPNVSIYTIHGSYGINQYTSMDPSWDWLCDAIGRSSDFFHVHQILGMSRECFAPEKTRPADKQ